MDTTAPRTTKPVAATRPTRGSTRAARSVAPHSPKIPSSDIVKDTAGPAVKLGNAPAAKDPRFQKVMVRLQKSAAKTKQHPPAQRKAAEAQAAAKPPANEKLAGAQANQVDVMQSAEGKKPEKSSFLDLLRAEIAKIMPKTLGDTENFMQGDQPQKLKDTMTGNVNQQKEDASGELKAASSQAPDTSKVEGKAVTPLPTEGVPQTPQAVGAVEAVPESKPESEVSLQQSKKETEQQLRDAEVTHGQLQEANDARFSAVITAKSDVAEQADNAPKEFRSAERRTLVQETTKAVSDEKQGLTALQHEKGKAGPAVRLRQLTAKQQDEARRKAVTDTIEKIYNETKQRVETKLASLENDVSSMFDKGIEAAMAKMKNYIDQKMDAYKDERYGSLGGGLKWAKDKLFGMPDEVNVFYENGRKLFMQDLEALIVNIAGVVETRLKEAKEEVARGQARIRDYVKSLPKDLQEVGKAAEKEVAGRFEEMSKGIDEKKNALAQKLAQRYKEATDKANEQLKKMQEENKGLVTKFVEKLGEIIKILREFKERISSMLKQGRDTIMLIVAHPIRFLGYLIDAIAQGVQQFSRNILKHLEKGLMDWLFGSLAEAGIELPPDFSPGSILKLVLQVLGLTYDRIRAKVVKLIGERNVALLEKAWQFISALLKGSPAALWEQIKEFLGNLKEMVINAIRDWVVETIIHAAIAKLISMFNPVGAIIQAIMAIYNTVMFFIERINQILAFVEAIIKSVHKIATGDIASAANWIEQALAKSIPIIIGFLARLIGLGGISNEIKKIIQKIQSVVDNALNKFVNFIVGKAKGLIRKGKETVKNLAGWWKAKTQFVGNGKEKHTIYFTGEGVNATLMIASAPIPYADFIQNKIKTKDLDDDMKAARNEALRVAKQIDELKRKDSETGIQDEQILELLNELAIHTKILASGTTEVPPSVITYGPLTPQDGATLMVAQVLSKKGAELGSEPADTPEIWTQAKRRKGIYVRGHLLNHNLGGPGRAYNLTTITDSANKDHLHSVESDIKSYVLDSDGVVKYVVEVVYGKHPIRSSQKKLQDQIDDPKANASKKARAQKKLDAMNYEQNFLAMRFKTSWVKLEHNGDKWVQGKNRPKNATIENELPDDDNIDV